MSSNVTPYPPSRDEVDDVADDVLDDADDVIAGVEMGEGREFVQFKEKRS